MFMGRNPNRRLWVQSGIIYTERERLSGSYIIFVYNRVYRFWLFVLNFWLLLKKVCAFGRKKFSKNCSFLGQFLTEAIFKSVSPNFCRKLAQSVGRPKFTWNIEACIAIFQTIFILTKFISRKNQLKIQSFNRSYRST